MFRVSVETEAEVGSDNDINFPLTNILNNTEWIKNESRDVTVFGLYPPFLFSS